MIQDGGLQLKDMEVDEALELGLVFTEPAFMTRTSNVFRRKQSDIPRTEEWNMFSYCFNVSRFEVAVTRVAYLDPLLKTLLQSPKIPKVGFLLG